MIGPRMTRYALNKAMERNKSLIENSTVRFLKTHETYL